MNTTSLRIASLLLAACGLAACQQRSEDPTVGQKVDKAIESAREGTQDAKTEIKQAAEEAKTAGGQAADKMQASVNDASITASVNAALAKDASLSALKINVDTQAGRVVLRGSAPDEAARQRATQLAAAVKGVVSVDNHLALEARS
jgi:hyperosmotically inducible protein